jgi:hypothetical protein
MQKSRRGKWAGMASSIADQEVDVPIYGGQTNHKGDGNTNYDLAMF